MPNLLHVLILMRMMNGRTVSCGVRGIQPSFFPGAGQLFIGKHFRDGDVVQNGNYKYLQEFIHTCNKNIVIYEMCYRGRKLGNLNFYQTVLALLRISLSKCTQFPAVWREEGGGGH